MRASITYPLRRSWARNLHNGLDDWSARWAIYRDGPRSRVDRKPGYGTGVRATFDLSVRAGMVSGSYRYRRKQAPSRSGTGHHQQQLGMSIPGGLHPRQFLAFGFGG